MLDDKRCVQALLKIISEHRLQGSEAPALLQLIQWVNRLDERLNVKPSMKAVKKTGLKK